MDKQGFSVSEVNQYLKQLLESQSDLHHIPVLGEVSNFKRYGSGHCYFTLKDEKSALKCVMFKSSAVRLSFTPQNGEKVVALGSISVYERDGVYQLYVSAMRRQGIGDLMQAYEALKEKLTKEGLFDASRKKPLPRLPRAIGIITSPSGAAVHDIITVSRRRNKGVKLILYPASVQGEEAAGEIVHAIDFFQRNHLADLLIVGRGGGSIEDLWASMRSRWCAPSRHRRSRSSALWGMRRISHCRTLRQMRGRRRLRRLRSLRSSMWRRIEMASPFIWTRRQSCWKKRSMRMHSWQTVCSRSSRRRWRRSWMRRSTGSRSWRRSSRC